MNVTDFRECGAACAAKNKEPPVSQELPGNLLLLTLYVTACLSLSSDCQYM